MSIKNFASYGDLESVLPSYANAIKEKAKKDMVADAFDATATYAEGDYCTYEGGLYKFKASHSGAWDAADVDQIQIAGEISELKNTLTGTDYGQLNTNKAKLSLSKKSGIAFLTIEELSSIAAGADLIDGIVPVGYRPGRSYRISLLQRNSSFQRIVQLTVTSSGNIEIYNYGSAITEALPFSGTLSYPIT